MGEEALMDYIKKRKYHCVFCQSLQAKVIEHGLVAIDEYSGMVCGGVEDMINRKFDLIAGQPFDRP
jgi:hypothetical protein